MSIRRLGMLMSLLLILTSTGCCRWCERWCPQQHAAVPAPQYYAAPAPVPVAQTAGSGCVCVPICCQAAPGGGAVAQPVPVYGKTQSWQKNYFTPGCCE